MFNQNLLFLHVLLSVCLSRSWIKFAAQSRQLQQKQRTSKMFAYSATEETPASRRKKVNKYERFSSAPDDPLLKTLDRVKTDQIEDEMEKRAHIRGTSIPSASLPTNTPKRSHTFDDLTLLDPNDPLSFGYSQIGSIIGPHGVKGEIKVKVDTDFADEHLASGSVLFMRKPNRKTPRPIVLVSGRRQVGDVFLIKIKGITSRIGAATFTGYDIFVDASDRPILQTDEYLVRDLVGMRVYHSSRYVGDIAGVVLPDDLCTPAAGKSCGVILHYSSTILLSYQLVDVPFSEAHACHARN